MTEDLNQKAMQRVIEEGLIEIMRGSRYKGKWDGSLWDGQILEGSPNPPRITRMYPNPKHQMLKRLKEL
jgi:hypothetical protein